MATEDKGRAFEARVRALCEALVVAHPDHVRLECQPIIELQNKQRVRPDFHLIVELPYERSHYFIECQDRAKPSSGVLHKIQHVRSKQPFKTFIFVHSERMDLQDSEVDRALRQEGVIVLSAKGLEESFLAPLSQSLQAMEAIDRKANSIDRAAMGSAEEALPGQRGEFIQEMEAIDGKADSPGQALLGWVEESFSGQRGELLQALEAIDRKANSPDSSAMRLEAEWYSERRAAASRIASVSFNPLRIAAVPTRLEVVPGPPYSAGKQTRASAYAVLFFLLIAIAVVLWVVSDR